MDRDDFNFSFLAMRNLPYILAIAIVFIIAYNLNIKK